MQQTTAYESSDGTLFRTEQGAREHEALFTVRDVVNALSAIQHPVGSDDFMREALIILADHADRITVVKKYRYLREGEALITPPATPAEQGGTYRLPTPDTDALAGETTNAPHPATNPGNLL